MPAYAGMTAERFCVRGRLPSIRVARRHLAGDLGAFLEVAANDQVGGGRAGPVGLLVAAIAAVEAGDHAAAAFAIAETSAGGVLGGAASANQPVETSPGRPASAVVGISGSAGERWASQSARILTRPSR